MFKDEFKKANDTIHADEALVNKVLALKDVKNRPKRRKPVYYVPAAAAAVVIAAASAAAVPMLTKINSRSDIIYQSADIYAGTADSAEAPKSLPSHTAAPADTASEGRTSISGAASKSAPADASSKRGTAPSATDVPYVTALPQQSIPKTGYSEPVYGDIAPAGEPRQSLPLDPPYEQDAAPQSSSQEDAPVINSKISSVVLSMNTAHNTPLTANAYTADDPYDGELTYAEWTDEDYFSYLGRSLEPELSDDFSPVLYGGGFDAALKDDGTPLFDTRAFTYEGAGGRCVTIQTSKDLDIVMNYLTDDGYIKSSVNGTAAVLIGTAEDCAAYMESGGISYVINARGLSEDELKLLLLSLSE